MRAGLNYMVMPADMRASARHGGVLNLNVKLCGSVSLHKKAFL